MMAFNENSTISSDIDGNREAAMTSNDGESSREIRAQRKDATLLDLYSGCGAMSTGLCMGAQLSGLNLFTVRHFCKLIIMG